MKSKYVINLIFFSCLCLFQFQSLADQEETEDIKVAIYFRPVRGVKPSFGYKGMFMALEDYYYKVEYIKEIKSEILKKYDVFILPVVHQFHPDIDAKKIRKTMRDYVKNGGGLLLNKHSWVFPEIASPLKIQVGEKKIYAPITYTPVVVTDKNHPICHGLPERFTLQYDGSPFKAGSWGNPIMKFMGNGIVNGVPVVLNDVQVVIVGNYGKGRIAMIGALLGIDKLPRDMEAPPKGPMLKLFLNSVRWLARSEERMKDKKNKED